MGILSGTSGESLKLAWLQKWSSLLCILLYISGLLYGLVLVWPSVSLNTYFSENALLPAIVDEHFSAVQSIARTRNELKVAAKQTKDANNSGVNLPITWLMSKLDSLGLETFSQNFTVSFPFSKETLDGTNVYGIVRAPRGASLESIVLATPFKYTSYAPIALLLPFARYCQEQIYWAKDIIFVFTDMEELGMQVWLSAYHGRQMQYVNYSPLYGRGGSIQAGIALDSDRFSGPVTHIDIKYNMLNGKLPNLDLINVVVKMCEKEALKPTVHGKEEYYYDAYTLNGYVNYGSTAISALLSQAESKPDGLHSVFGSFGIEAVTLNAKQKNKVKSTDPAAYSLNSIARILEGSVRSLNNLLERLHQSYFFYVLVSPHKFVSIGLYMPALVLIALAPVLKGLSIWLELNAEDEAVTQQGHSLTQAFQFNLSLFAAVPFLILCHILGALVLYIPSWLNVYFSKHSSTLQQDHILFALALSIALALLVFPCMLSRNIGRSSMIASSAVLRCVLLLQFALLLGVTALLNFGLAFILAITLTPFILFMKPFNNKFMQVTTTALGFCLNPLCILFMYCIIMSSFHVPDMLAADYIIKHALHSTKTIVTRVVYESWLLDSWALSWICLGLIPFWTLLWTFINQPVIFYQTNANRK